MKERCWLSLIVQTTETSKPWLCAMTESFANLDEAKKEIDFKKKQFIVLSAWVDTFKDNMKNTIYHECYMD